MTRGRVLAAAGAALALITGGVAYAASTGPTASCVADPAPAVTTSLGGGTVSFTSAVTCTAAIPVTTVTVTAPPTATPSTSSTTSPPNSTTTTTTSAPSPTSTTPPPATDWTRPTAATTGYHGTLTPWAGGTTFTANNQTITNTDFGGYIKVTGTNLVLDNCHFDGMVFFGPGPLTVRNCTSNGGINSDAWYGNITGVTYDHDHVIAGAHDGIDVFSGNGHTETGIAIVDTLIDGMSFPAGSTSHGDGLQVRGVNGLTVTRVVVNDGPYQSQDNSAIYFENVNGGDTRMALTDLDLYGGGYTFYTNAVTASTATDVAVRAAGRWGPYHANTHPPGWVFTNVTGPTGVPLTP